MDHPDFVEDDFKFKTPFGLILSGASGSGKSTLQMKFLAQCDELMDRKPDSILYIYHTPQSMFDQYKDKAQFYNGWDHPDLQLPNLLKRKNLLWFIDDSIEEAPKDFLKDAFQKYIHHMEWSIILSIHNPFDKDIKSLRTMSLSSQYQIFCASPRIYHAIKMFAIQCWSHKWKYFMEIVEKILNSETKFGHILCDFHPKTDPKYSVRSNIFAEGTPMCVFIPKE